MFKKLILSTAILGLTTPYIFATPVAPSNDLSAMTNKQTEQKDSQTNYLNISQAVLKKQREEQAALWGLTEQDWSKFEEIKKGPRGYWSPTLDPLIALGIETETDAERQHYAEIQARIEFERAEKELAYQRAYTVAFQKLYPNKLPIAKLGSGANLFSSSTVAGKQRFALFIKQHCVACDTQVKQFQKNNIAVDIYMIGSNNDDAVICKWATAVGINPKNVLSKQITLNHGAKLWQTVGDNQQQLPVTYQDINGQLIKK